MGKDICSIANYWKICKCGGGAAENVYKANRLDSGCRKNRAGKKAENRVYCYNNCEGDVNVMPDFAQQLTAARKAKHMTQEALAQAVHISRSRVSRWEHGETVPDVEMLRKLSEVLEVDFLSTGKPTEAALPEMPAEEPQEAVAQEAQAADAPVQQPAVKRVWLAAAAVGVILLAVVLLLALPRKAAPAQVYEPYTMAWYQQEQSAVAGQAYVKVGSVENPVKAIRFEEFTGGVGWFYSIRCEETAGVPFTVKKIIHTVFNAAGQDDSIFEGEQLAGIMGDTTLRKDRPMPFEFGGGFPLQNVKGVGLAVEGVDANGNELVFRGYVELSQEIAE